MRHEITRPAHAPEPFVCAPDRTRHRRRPLRHKLMNRIWRGWGDQELRRCG